MKIILAMLCLASPISALGPSSETLNASAASAFSALSAFRPVRTKALGLKGAPAAPRVRATAATRYVRLSGYVTLQGSGHVPKGSHSAYITVSGSTYIEGDGGRITSGYVSINQTDFYTVNGDWVNGWSHPSAYVSLYRDGKYLGQARVSGSFYLSGHANGDWVHLSGSGSLTGDIQITED